MVKTQGIKTPFVRKVEFPKPYKIGDIAEGPIVGIGRSAIYLNLGARGTGIIYGRAFLEEKDRLRDVKMGDTLAAKILELDNENGYVELSLKEAGRQLAWEQLKEKKEKEETIHVRITGANRGGLLAEVSGVPAFLPVSQLAAEHYPKVEGGDPNKILEELQKFVGEELEVSVESISPSENKLILSERAKERSRIKEILERYPVGTTVEGEITGIVDFGAFVTFGEEKIEGLIHISEIDWQIIDDPSQYLKMGDKVKAKIIDVAGGRVSLSLKALKDDPWKGMEEKYQKLDIVQGKVTKLNPFGAFVEVESKIQGLAHISEFGTKKHLEEKLEVGKTYSFQILDLNTEEHRMTLKPLESSSSRPKPEEKKQQPEETQGEKEEPEPSEQSPVGQ
ncbi:S1 RNA-binding domain-containing protein [Patescibacteria group bacterium]|nr:S1 RNA-binding domain-containing protein [Patescibacteria group bacterium]